MLFNTLLVDAASQKSRMSTLEHPDLDFDAKLRDIHRRHAPVLRATRTSEFRSSRSGSKGTGLSGVQGAARPRSDRNVRLAPGADLETVGIALKIDAVWIR